ncbi:desumoylating isopeptidase [Anaeramoeba flamelloides]|uniref:Desumoylating isopeptidase n=1 Tax=Anaeramoeba flamelloides TaxID=1746091 RepID=A0AAV7Y483_9EUKA|nr:desumoylating isopeptidase [Anaeramoeba flamelloides]
MTSEIFKVSLHVYDLSMGFAKVLSPMFIGKQIDGIYHSAVVVYGREYFYGGGICDGTPGRTPFGNPIKSEEIGETVIPKDVFVKFLRNISMNYTFEAYDLITNNCNNFSNEVCEFLTGNQIPSYILDLPKIALQSPMGKMIEPFLTNLNKSAQLNPEFGQQESDMNVPIHVPEIHPNQSMMGMIQNQLGGGSGQNLNINSLLNSLGGLGGFGGMGNNNTNQNTNYNTNNRNNYSNSNSNSNNTLNYQNQNQYQNQSQNINKSQSNNKVEQKPKRNYLQPNGQQKKNFHKHDNLTNIKITKNQIPIKFSVFKIESIVEKIYSFQIEFSKEEISYFEEIKTVLSKAKKNIQNCQETISQEILQFLKALLENKLNLEQMFPVLDLIRILILLPLAIEDNLQILIPFLLRCGSELMNKLESLEETEKDLETAQTIVIDLMMIVRSFVNTFQHEKAIKYWISQSNLNTLIEFLSSLLLLDHNAITDNLVLHSSSLFVNVAMLFFKLKEENTKFNDEDPTQLLTTSIILLQRFLEQNDEYTIKQNQSIFRLMIATCKILWRDDSCLELFEQFSLDFEKFFEKKDSKSYTQVNSVAKELRQLLN